MRREVQKERPLRRAASILLRCETLDFASVDVRTSRVSGDARQVGTCRVQSREAARDEHALHAAWVEHQEAQVLKDRETDLAQVRAISRHHCQRDALWNHTEELRISQNIDRTVTNTAALEKRCAPQVSHHTGLQQLALRFAVDVILRPLQQVRVVARIEEEVADRQVMTLNLSEG